jgi:hypothetical protein
MNETITEAPTTPARPILNVAEAEGVIRHLSEVMDRLLAVVEHETTLVRAGKLAEAQKLEATKTELSRQYTADTARIRASQRFLNQATPAIADDLRKRHDLFRAVLQMNLTVLATAHAVSESIMRGVSAELARKATPHAYGATGHATKPPASSQQPLTLSRVL